MATVTDARELLTTAEIVIGGERYELQATTLAIAAATRELNKSLGEVFGVREMCRLVLKSDLNAIGALAWALMLDRPKRLTIDELMADFQAEELDGAGLAIMQAFNRMGWLGKADAPEAEDESAEKNASSTGAPGGDSSSAASD